MNRMNQENTDNARNIKKSNNRSWKTSYGRREHLSVDAMGKIETKANINIDEIRKKAEIGELSGEICGICKTKFGTESITITSCGHLFHRICLNSFKRLLKEDRIFHCPICREVYTSSDVIIESEILTKSAISIQRVFRGYLVRRNLNKLTPIGSKLHRRWILSLTQNTSERLSAAMDRQNENVDIILDSIDSQLEWARTVMRSVEARGRRIEWDYVRSKARERVSICPICLQSIEAEECAVTSCIHCFHGQCLNSWIQFCSRENRTATCPECRSFFQYRPLIEGNILNIDINISNKCL